MSGNEMSGNEMSGNEMSGNEMSGNEMSGNEMSGNAVSGNAVSGNAVSGGENSKKQVALFIDLENFVGFCDSFGLNVELEQVIAKLAEHGRVVIRRSFGDMYKLPMHFKDKEKIRVMLQNNLIQHEDVRHLTQYKNSSDIRLTVEALSVAYSNPTIDAFAIIADDRDYIPLFAKLRELGKTLIGIGSSEHSTQQYYRSACDHFYYHDALAGSRAILAQDAEKADEILAFFDEAVKAVEETGDLPLGTNVAQMIRSLRPGLNFEEYGFAGLRAVASLAERRGFVELVPRGGDILITRIDEEIKKHFEESQDVEAGSDGTNEQALLARKYKYFVQGKLKAVLPEPDIREKIYDAAVEELESVDFGISLRDLSNDVANNLDLASNPDLHTSQIQKSAYKILYGLFRQKVFDCLEVYDPYNPCITDLSIDRDDMDKTFIINTLSVFKKENEGLPFDSAAWARCFYDDEAQAEVIADWYAYAR